MMWYVHQHPCADQDDEMIVRDPSLLLTPPLGPPQHHSHDHQYHHNHSLAPSQRQPTSLLKTSASTISSSSASLMFHSCSRPSSGPLSTTPTLKPLKQMRREGRACVGGCAPLLPWGALSGRAIYRKVNFRDTRKKLSRLQRLATGRKGAGGGYTV